MKKPNEPPDMSDESCLSEEQWTELREGINQAILDGLDTPQKIENIKLQVARVVSHIDSQRRVEEINSRTLHEHHQLLHGVGEAEGLKAKVTETYKAVSLFKRLSWIAMSMLVVVFVKALWEVAVRSGIKP